LKKQKRLEKRNLVAYLLFLIFIFLLSFYLSYRFNIGGQFFAVVNQTTPTSTTTTTTVKPIVETTVNENVKTTTTLKTTTSTTIEETTTTVKYVGGGGDSGGKATTTSIPLPVAKIIINELMYNPPGSDEDNEWVEIYNNDTFDCDITDWSFFESGTNHRLTLQQGSIIIPASAYAILANNATSFLINHPGFNRTVIKSSFSLSNDGEYIALKDYSSNVVDEITYNSSWGGNGNNKTLERVGNDWCESLVIGGTPGFENSVHSCGITTTSSTTTTTSTSTTTSTLQTTTSSSTSTSTTTTQPTTTTTIPITSTTSTTTSTTTTKCTTSTTTCPSTSTTSTSTTTTCKTTTTKCTTSTTTCPTTTSSTTSTSTTTSSTSTTMPTTSTSTTTSTTSTTTSTTTTRITTSTTTSSTTTSTSSTISTSSTTTSTTVTSTTIPILANHVVISEFLADSSGLESAYEFVELYNPINSPINITGWNIAYKSAAGTSWSRIADITGSIQAYGFFLVGGNSVNPTPDVIDTSLGFSSTGGHIALRNATNYIIDKVGYGNAIDPEGNACPAPPTDQSMERKPGYLNPTAGNGWDSDDNLEDFILRNETEPQNSTFIEIPY